MTQNLVDPLVWKQLKFKSQNIDKLLEWALQKQNLRICHKHSNISNTVKHLKNLMLEFSKKADNLQKSLTKAMRIQEIQFQSSYYQKRISECLAMSQTIRNQMQSKNKVLMQKQMEANKLKKILMKYKTQNIKLNMKIQQLIEYSQMIELRQNNQAQKQRRKIKNQEDRKMLTCESFKKQSTLKQQNCKLQIQLFNKIDKAKQLRVFIEECFSGLKQKLKKQEKKSNMYGLAGSMIFKLQANQDSSLLKFKKPSQSKLLVYDTLREKYKKHLKNENKKNQQLKISLEQFMKFNPLQIMGIIELKGGLKQIINKKYSNKTLQAKDQIQA